MLSLQCDEVLAQPKFTIKWQQFYRKCNTSAIYINIFIFILINEFCTRSHVNCNSTEDTFIKSRHGLCL